MRKNPNRKAISRIVESQKGYALPAPIVEYIYGNSDLASIVEYIYGNSDLEPIIEDIYGNFVGFDLAEVETDCLQVESHTLNTRLDEIDTPRKFASSIRRELSEAIIDWYAERSQELTAEKIETASFRELLDAVRWRLEFIPDWYVAGPEIAERLFPGHAFTKTSPINVARLDNRDFILAPDFPPGRLMCGKKSCRFLPGTTFYSLTPSNRIITRFSIVGKTSSHSVTFTEKPKKPTWRFLDQE